jgi:lipopolysaccharide heptosyltransferase I
MTVSRRRILLVRLGSLGDIIHSLPVAASLRESIPHVHIDWLVDTRHRAILDLVPVINRRIVVQPSARGFLSTIRSLRTERYDEALDLQGLWKSALLARGSGARRVIGFSREHLREPGARLFYSEACSAVEGPHVIQKNLSLLRTLGLDTDQLAIKFPIQIPQSAVLEDVRRELNIRGGDRFAIINPGAAWPNKRWPTDHFGRLAAEMLARHGVRSAVLWGPGERLLAQAVASSAKGSAIVTPQTSLGDLLALARAACIMISGDTGPLHLAAAVGTPVVALFGPTDPQRNGPWSSRDISLSGYTRCICHYQRRCTRTVPCLSDIGVDEVLDAIEVRLTRARAHG